MPATCGTSSVESTGADAEVLRDLGFPVHEAAFDVCERAAGASLPPDDHPTETIDPRQLLLSSGDAAPSAKAAWPEASEDATWPDLFSADGRLKRPPNRYVLWQRSLSAARRKELSSRLHDEPDSSAHKHMVKAWNELDPAARQRIDAQYEALVQRYRDTVESLKASGQAHRLPKAPVRSKDAQRKGAHAPPAAPKTKPSRGRTNVEFPPTGLGTHIDDLSVAPPDAVPPAGQHIECSLGSRSEGPGRAQSISGPSTSRLSRSVFDSELFRHGPLVARTSWEPPAQAHSGAGPSAASDLELLRCPQARSDVAAPPKGALAPSSAIAQHQASLLRFPQPDEEHDPVAVPCADAQPEQTRQRSVRGAAVLHAATDLLISHAVVSRYAWIAA